MLPISTLNNPTRRLPYLTYGLILVNVIVFIWETTLPPAELGRAFMNLSVVPCQLTQNFFSLETGLDLLRSMFLHGSWLHLLGNMLYLWIFGSNVEDFFGRRAFILMYLAGGAAAALTETLVQSNSCTPMVGASGAIAGILGSYIILYPGVKVRVVVIFFRIIMRTFAIPALFVLGYWFAIQLISGIGALDNIETLSGGIAFWAHIGGFVFGGLFAFIFTLFVPRPPQPAPA